MSDVKEFFRHCPACGRRFHIKLVSKTLVDDRKDVRVIPRSLAMRAPAGFSRVPMLPIVVTENIPITVDIEDFQYSYKCGHCGHVWSEMHVEESRT